MPTFVLSPGVVVRTVQNLVYALPASRCVIYADSGTLEQSADGSNFTAIVLTNNQAEVAGAFIRDTVGGSDVVVKKM